MKRCINELKIVTAIDEATLGNREGEDAVY
jgi:hypothetical protein